MTETIRQIMAAFAQEPAAVPLAEDVVLQDHAQGRLYQGRAEVEQLLRAFFIEGVPAARAEVHSITADETVAALECTFRGKQEGPFRGLPVTGREVALPMVIVCQISDGQIDYLNVYCDAGGLLRQLGMAL